MERKWRGYLMSEPIQIIYDVEALEGTCYVELKPGKFKGNHWGKDSIYFTDETFSFFSLAIQKNYKRYSLFGVSEIDKQTWGLIIAELERLKTVLQNNPTINELKKHVIFLLEEITENNFLKDFNENINRLIKVITELQTWVINTIKEHDFISILGI
jgi:cell fate (sporulation/competence/biofilm development) regulator YlbF (YheA/YmcA/DUF963 family)